MTCFEEKLNNSKPEKGESEMNSLILAVSEYSTGQQIALGAGVAVYSAIYILLWIFGVILAIMLFIAPLRIWSWTKRACGELSEIRHLLRTAIVDSKKDAKEMKQILSAVNKHLANVESAMFEDGTGSAP